MAPRPTSPPTTSDATSTPLRSDSMRNAWVTETLGATSFTFTRTRSQDRSSSRSSSASSVSALFCTMWLKELKNSDLCSSSSRALSTSLSKLFTLLNARSWRSHCSCTPIRFRQDLHLLRPSIPCSYPAATSSTRFAFLCPRRSRPSDRAFSISCSGLVWRKPRISASDMVNLRSESYSIVIL